MKDFIKALYADLLHRIDVVIADIQSIEHHEDIRERFVDETILKFETIRTTLQDSFDSGVLDFEELAGNNLYKFNKAHREFKAIHSYRYLALKSYNKAEIYFFRLISKIYAEHRISATPPIVSTISNHDYYFWAVPYFEIIALPSGEENCLLNLPDMYHEIGHLLHSMFKGKSCENSGVIVDAHFEKEIVRVEEEGIAEHYLALLEEAKYLWQESWIEEFTCDLVGTYMTGVAYAWTNLKLLTTSHGSTKIYEYSQSHPADEARMRIIILMLEKLGLVDEKVSVETVWNLFLRDTESFKPSGYSLLYPQILLEQIVDEFFAFYQNADLASYPEISNGDTPSVAQLLCEAWSKAQNNPLEYFQHESDAIDALKNEFGMS